jgi:hypothetical protein
VRRTWGWAGLAALIDVLQKESVERVGGQTRGTDRAAL